MINTKELSKIKEDLEEFDKQRENIIFLSRIILKASKSAIYSAHRCNFKEAKANLDEAQDNIRKAQKLIARIPDLRGVGAYSSSLEEYSEAVCFYSYVKENKLPSFSELSKHDGVSSEEYLLGLCDFTGEMARLAVILATARKFKELQKIRDVVDEIFGFFSQLDMRNSELRKKSDSIKWNLKKIEEVLYDISMKK
jgi:translin